MSIPATPFQRDPRLDFFRGLAMLIIFIAHVPNNYWGFFLPAKFGFSDATEMFVFCSGFAAAIAFGGSFRRHGFWMGTARVAYRCYQIYVAHLGLFFALATICVIGTAWFSDPNYIIKLNLGRFFEDTQAAMVGLFTLTYVPNYFDILPMYIGALALMPLMMLLARYDTRVPLVFSVTLWTCVWLFGWNFLADASIDRVWFFNPLAWQLLFYTGFALSAGWLEAPPRNWRLLTGAILFVAIVVPLDNWPIYNDKEWIWAIREAIWPLISKTNFGLLRYIHFLALAYIVICLLQGREHWLRMRWAAPIIKTGQQALPVFLTSMILSWIGGMYLDQTDRDNFHLAVMNLTGLGLVIGSAYLYAWFKSEPWRRKPAPVSDPRDQLQVDPNQAGAWRPVELPAKVTET